MLQFLAMMSVKECLQRFLLQINQINKIKHSGSAQKRLKKTRFLCNFNVKSIFSLTQRAITRRSVITLGPIFTKMVLNRAQGSKEKSQEVSVRKNVNQRRYNKKLRRGDSVRLRYVSLRLIRSAMLGATFNLVTRIGLP